MSLHDLIAENNRYRGDLATSIGQCQKLEAENAQLKAELAANKSQYSASEEINVDLRMENTALKSTIFARDLQIEFAGGGVDGHATDLTVNLEVGSEIRKVNMSLRAAHMPPDDRLPVKAKVGVTTKENPARPQ